MIPTTFKTIDPLTEEARKAWVLDTGARISQSFQSKFAIGQVAHGGQDIGHVSVKSLLDEAEAEARDQSAYLAELRRRLTEAPPILSGGQINTLKWAVAVLQWVAKWVPYKKVEARDVVPALQAIINYVESSRK